MYPRIRAADQIEVDSAIQRRIMHCATREDLRLLYLNARITAGQLAYEMTDTSE